MKAIRKLFIRNELLKLAQNDKNQFVILSLLFCLLIVALNQSFFGLKKLKEKNDNPYATYMQVAMPMKEGEDRFEKANSIIKFFNGTDLKRQLNLNRINFIYYEFLDFINPNNNKIGHYKGRTFNPDDELYKELTKKGSDNLILLNELDTSDLNFQYGIIITEKMCRELNFDSRSIKLIPHRLAGNEFVLLPVKAVVNSLPQFSDFMMSDDFYYIYNESKTYHTLGSGNEYSVISFKDSLNPNLAMLKLFNEKQTEEITIDRKAKYFRTIFTLSDYLDEGQKEFITDSLSKTNELRQLLYNDHQLQYVSVPEDASMSPEYLEFKFNKLDSIESFQDYCSKFNLEPDMQVIKIKQLFGEVGNISRLLAIGFFIFAIFILFIFTNSFISRHIEDIKPNLGTIMAYGMNGKLIISTYLIVILIIYSVSFSFGMVLAGILVFILNWIFNIEIIYHYYILGMMVIAIILTLLYAKYIISKIFKNTPGDLIYKR